MATRGGGGGGGGLPTSAAERAAWVQAVAADLQRQWIARWTERRRRQAGATASRPAPAPAPTPPLAAEGTKAMQARLLALVRQVKQYEDPTLQAQALQCIPREQIEKEARKFLAARGLDDAHLQEAVRALATPAAAPRPWATHVVRHGWWRRRGGSGCDGCCGGSRTSSSGGWTSRPATPAAVRSVAPRLACLKAPLSRCAAGPTQR